VPAYIHAPDEEDEWPLHFPATVAKPMDARIARMTWSRSRVRCVHGSDESPAIRWWVQACASVDNRLDA